MKLSYALLPTDTNLCCLKRVMSWHYLYLVSSWSAGSGDETNLYCIVYADQLYIFNLPKETPVSYYCSWTLVPLCQ